MPLKKLQFKPGINKEVTAYAAEGTWVDCDKVRFRRGFPEKIGGWQRISSNTFLGTARSLMEWVTLAGLQLMGLGTHLKYYLVRGAAYFDITPIRATTAAGDVTFAASNGSSVLTVSDTAHGATAGDFVTYSGAVTLGGNITAAVLNDEYQIVTVINANSYTIDVGVTANASDVGNGGAAVVGAYQISIGNQLAQPFSGWGAGGWSSGAWGSGATSITPARIWNHTNYGEDLIFGPRRGALYYWDATGGVTVRGTAITGSDVPVVHYLVKVSDSSRFVICFGVNEIGSSTLDAMLVRWSDQEDYTNWTPAVTNQAGSFRLSQGSQIVAAEQNRQEILVWTDTAMYSMQYLGPPYVWGFQLMGENISIMSSDSAVIVNGVAYWMGTDKFYAYDGRVRTLECDVRDFVFNHLILPSAEQVTAGTNEAYNEIWWFYPTTGSAENDAYVVYNYVENTWYTGSLSRTAWLDSVLQGKPIAAGAGQVLVEHEVGTDDASTGSPTAIEAYVESADVDIDDGDRFAFIRRMLPDISFDGSSAASPAVTMQLRPKNSSGSGYKSPASVGASAEGTVTRTVSVPVEQYTEQVNVRVRGRQMSLRITSDGLGVAWQLGTPRADIRPDGRRA